MGGRDGTENVEHVDSVMEGIHLRQHDRKSIPPFPSDRSVGQSDGPTVAANHDEDFAASHWACGSVSQGISVSVAREPPIDHTLTTRISARVRSPQGACAEFGRTTSLRPPPPPARRAGALPPATHIPKMPGLFRLLPGRRRRNTSHAADPREVQRTPRDASFGIHSRENDEDDERRGGTGEGQDRHPHEIRMQSGTTHGRPSLTGRLARALSSNNLRAGRAIHAPDVTSDADEDECPRGDWPARSAQPATAMSPVLLSGNVAGERPGTLVHPAHRLPAAQPPGPGPGPSSLRPLRRRATTLFRSSAAGATSRPGASPATDPPGRTTPSVLTESTPPAPRPNPALRRHFSCANLSGGAPLSAEDELRRRDPTCPEWAAPLPSVTAEGDDATALQAEFTWRASTDPENREVYRDLAVAMAASAVDKAIEAAESENARCRERAPPGRERVEALQYVDDGRDGGRGKRRDLNEAADGAWLERRDGRRIRLKHQQDHHQ